MRQGWIKLWRGCEEHYPWKVESYDKTHAYWDLMLLANGDPKNKRQKPGEVWTSERTLASRWGWSQAAVHRFLRRLAKNGYIVNHPESLTESQSGSRFFLLEWEKTQVSESLTESQTESNKEDIEQHAGAAEDENDGWSEWEA